MFVRRCLSLARTCSPPSHWSRGTPPPSRQTLHAGKTTMNLRHLKLWKRHAAASDVSGDVGKSRDVVDVRSPSSDSGYSDVAPTSSMFSRQHGQPGHHGHPPAHRSAGADQRDRGRSSAVAAELSGRRKTDTPAAAGLFRGLRNSSTARSGGDSTRRTLSPQSAEVKSPTAPKPTSADGVTVEAFFAVVREGNVDKLRQFLRDTKFDVNTRDTVRYGDQFSFQSCSPYTKFKFKRSFCRTMLCISAAYAVVRCHVRAFCRNE